MPRHTLYSPDDEFAGFETLDKGSFGPNPNTPDMSSNKYARPALCLGLTYADSLGKNQFKFGLIGATDSHTSLAAAEHNNYSGKVSVLASTADPVLFEKQLTSRYSGEPQSNLG